MECRTVASGRATLPGTLFASGLALFAACASEAQTPSSWPGAADETAGEWPTYAGNYRGERFTRLDEVTRANVAGLRLAWVQETRSRSSRVTPLALDGVLYFPSSPRTVAALDARTGEMLWRRHLRVGEESRNLFGFASPRGVAVLGETVFAGTREAWLAALDRATGAVRWSVPVPDDEGVYRITVAPLAADGKVIVGVSGRDTPFRGFLDAYDAATGERVWRFWTVPSPDEPGGDTWAGDSWKTGGGATWRTGSYDPELGLLYWGVGSPAPNYRGDARAGDNLYTSSLLALDVDTGELRWHFQFTPHDTHGWDANRTPVLVDAEWEGEPRKLVVSANRNGFYYVLDRETGEFLLAAPFAKQTWAEGIAGDGRPIRLPGAEPSEEGAPVWPNRDGAVNWDSSAYDPHRRSLFVPVVEGASRYRPGDADYRAGEPFRRAEEGEGRYGAVRALDALTGAVRWESPRLSPSVSGVLATAGGLVFGGTAAGKVFALDSDTGEMLWDFRTGDTVESDPMSFSLDGKQFVVVTSGHSLFAFGLP